MNKRDVARAFRGRLRAVIERCGVSRTDFARQIGTDRSTLSQLLSADAVRLPRADTLVSIAALGHVSVDWLLGLSEEGSATADVVDEAVAISPGGASPTDARLARWHAEAAGYKIRYVPTTLPDLLKTEDVIRYEYLQHRRVMPENQIEQTEVRLAYSRRPDTDMEVCSSLQSLEAFAAGEGIWRALSGPARRRQLGAMGDLLDELYPTFRWFLFDARQRFVAPFTVFGPRTAAVYLGDMYLVFSATEHIRTFAAFFDGLIRDAVVQPPDVIDFVRDLSRAAR